MRAGKVSTPLAMASTDRWTEQEASAQVAAVYTGSPKNLACPQVLSQQTSHWAQTQLQLKATGGSNSLLVLTTGRRLKIYEIS